MGPSLTLSTSLAALAGLPHRSITKQQLRIYGWQLLGFVLLLIIVIGTNSDILGAPTPRLSKLICCPGSHTARGREPERERVREREQSPIPSSISRFDGVERCVRRIINIRKRKYIFYCCCCCWPAAVFDYCPGHRHRLGVLCLDSVLRFAVNCYWQRKQQCGTNWALNLRLALRSLASLFLHFFFHFYRFLFFCPEWDWDWSICCGYYYGWFSGHKLNELSYLTEISNIQYTIQ